MEELLRFEGVALGYSGVKVLEGINFNLYKGDFLGIVGPNGSGKTTLLKAMLGLLKPMSGKIIRSNSLLRFAYVPQREMMDELYPLTPWEIVMMSRYPLLGTFKWPGRADQGKVKEALDRLGILEVAHQLYRNLSGGQKQRTLIARALVGEPKVLILDEPTNGMDLKAEKSIMESISSLHREGITIILVTHVINLVANNAGRLALINEDFIIGDSADILTEKELTKAYGCPVKIKRDNEKIYIEAGENCE
jgi:ABC-type Mn2+/Zn2+ transport system ATPase subunit